MTAIVVVCCVVLVGGMLVIVIPKHTVGFMYDPTANITRSFLTVTQYYKDNKEVSDIFDIIIYATTLPITYFIVIGVCTSITAMKLQTAVKQRKSMTKVTTGTQKTVHLGTSMSSKEVAVTRMLIGTSILFLVCMIPNIGLQIFSLLLRELISTGVYSNLNLALWYFIFMCRGIRSSVNFCVYYIMGSKFRVSVHSLYLCVGQTSKGKGLNNGVKKVNIFGKHLPFTQGVVNYI
ncbi:uncharacterized protein LOC112560656 [Pomacea canaliculata]|uniref:uncharacterized protein LOC112560656 n=1 Tax=Pomacea canaliculata TaxID=400727 RepID=UPI000D72A523|nr:uncharacterized protein LOC112560656 [Pomacea canaliculata]